MKCVSLIDTGAMNRTADQEDEDTEQKIINEGSSPASNRDGACSQLLQSTRRGKRTALSFMT